MKTKVTGNPRKTAIVGALKDKLDKAKSFFLTDYRGLTHQQLEALRKLLKREKAEFLIAKNTLLKKTLTDRNQKAYEGLFGHLNNPTATLFAYGDVISAIKALSDFAKLNALPKIKGGFLDGKVATEADFQKIATLPPLDILLATLVMRLQSPLSGLHYALNWNLQKLVLVLNSVKNNKSSPPVGGTAGGDTSN